MVRIEFSPLVQKGVSVNDTIDQLEVDAETKPFLSQLPGKTAPAPSSTPAPPAG